MALHSLSPPLKAWHTYFPEWALSAYLLNPLSFPSFDTKYCYHHLRTLISWKQYMPNGCDIPMYYHYTMGVRRSLFSVSHTLLGENGGQGILWWPPWQLLTRKDQRKHSSSSIVKERKMLHACQKMVQEFCSELKEIKYWADKNVTKKWGKEGHFQDGHCACLFS